MSPATRFLAACNKLIESGFRSSFTEIYIDLPADKVFDVAAAEGTLVFDSGVAPARTRDWRALSNLWDMCYVEEAAPASNVLSVSTDDPSQGGSITFTLKLRAATNSDSVR